MIRERIKNLYKRVSYNASAIEKVAMGYDIFYRFKPLAFCFTLP